MELFLVVLHMIKEILILLKNINLEIIKVVSDKNNINEVILKKLILEMVKLLILSF